ncbi:unnamed protein product [Cyprideis torosa]|uniref:Uncharacterized protein n=1 Tax=Cyprideis torosa TaxID=163714 RepID=A0A7R8ZFR7_9CRUS|nr:unnamed protein product [Cyprideis torosa]CAG0879765.1 unnamed protein product [Cyprideis torosa]
MELFHCRVPSTVLTLVIVWNVIQGCHSQSCWIPGEFCVGLQHSVRTSHYFTPEGLVIKWWSDKHKHCLYWAPTVEPTLDGASAVFTYQNLISVARQRHYLGTVIGTNITIPHENVKPCSEYTFFLQPIDSMCVIGIPIFVGPRIVIEEPVFNAAFGWRIVLQDYDYQPGNDAWYRIGFKLGEGYHFHNNSVGLVVRGRLNINEPPVEKEAVVKDQNLIQMDGASLVVGGGELVEERRQQIANATLFHKQWKQKYQESRSGRIVSPSRQNKVYSLPKKLSRSGRVGMTNTYFSSVKPSTVYTPIVQCPNGEYWIGGKSFELLQGTSLSQKLSMNSKKGEKRKQSSGWYTHYIRPGPHSLSVLFKGTEIHISWEVTESDKPKGSEIMSYFLEIKPQKTADWDDALVFEIPATPQATHETTKIPSHLFEHCEVYEFREDLGGYQIGSSSRRTEGNRRDLLEWGLFSIAREICTMGSSTLTTKVRREFKRAWAAGSPHFESLGSRSSKEQELDSRSSKEQGLGSRSSKEQGLGSRSSKEQGLGSRSSKEQGLGSPSSKEQGLGNPIVEPKLSRLPRWIQPQLVDAKKDVMDWSETASFLPVNDLVTTMEISQKWLKANVTLPPCLKGITIHLYRDLSREWLYRDLTILGQGQIEMNLVNPSMDLCRHVYYLFVQSLAWTDGVMTPLFNFSLSFKTCKIPHEPAMESWLVDLCRYKFWRESPFSPLSTTSTTTARPRGCYSGSLSRRCRPQRPLSTTTPAPPPPDASEVLCHVEATLSHFANHSYICSEVDEVTGAVSSCVLEEVIIPETDFLILYIALGVLLFVLSCFGILCRHNETYRCIMLMLGIEVFKPLTPTHSNGAPKTAITLTEHRLLSSPGPSSDLGRTPPTVRTPLDPTPDSQQRPRKSSATKGTDVPFVHELVHEPKVRIRRPAPPPPPQRKPRTEDVETSLLSPDIH